MIMAIASTQRAGVRYLVELFDPANRLAAEGVLDAVRPA
jgi:hypothetical protein